MMRRWPRQTGSDAASGAASGTAPEPGSEASARSRSVPRQLGARWTDARLWGSVGLVVVATVLGALLLGRGGDTVLVLRAERDLAAGAVPQAVVPVAVPSEVAGGYVTVDDEIAGVLQWPVAAGDLLPRAALRATDTTVVRGVTIPVDPLHAPAGLSAGDLVDVWATPTRLGGPGWMESGSDQGADPGSSPSRVLARVLVTSVSTEGVGFGGGWGVELAVPEEDVARAVAAGRGSVIDLVTVPATEVSTQAPTDRSATAPANVDEGLTPA